MCTQMLMRMIAHKGCTYVIRESALKIDSGRKILCFSGESNLSQWQTGMTQYHLSYIPPHLLHIQLQSGPDLNQNFGIILFKHNTCLPYFQMTSPVLEQN